MNISVRFASLEGASVKTVRSGDFTDATSALAAVTSYAEASGFRNVKSVWEDDGFSIRYTATTPGGRHGRNVAFADIG